MTQIQRRRRIWIHQYYEHKRKENPADFRRNTNTIFKAVNFARLDFQVLGHGEFKKSKLSHPDSRQAGRQAICLLNDLSGISPGHQ